jgi:hypothetical protein
MLVYYCSPILENINMDNKNPDTSKVTQFHFDNAFYTQTALYRTESIANAIGYKTIPDHSSIYARLRLVNRTYYLMQHQKQPETGNEKTHPAVFFVKDQSVVNFDKVEKIPIVKDQDISENDRIPTIVPTAYVLFGNVKNPSDGETYWIGIASSEMVHNMYPTEKKLWERINSYNLLPIFNISGNPLDFNIIQPAQSIISLILKENEITKYTPSSEDNEAGDHCESLPEAAAKIVDKKLRKK